MQLSGCVHDLPGITQYMSITLGEGESLSICQSDMTSAFYLFGLPIEWRPYLAFNLVVDGKSVGLKEGRKYALACGVLPMGWASAVSVMQEASQLLLERHGLPREGQVVRTRLLPPWLTAVLGESRGNRKAWYHVYLDNFFAGERVPRNEAAWEVGALHDEAERAWNSAGVVSSAKKRIHQAEAVEELGAHLDGGTQMLGGSAERLHRLVQSTCLLLSMKRIPGKWLQVIMGRWVHILQFRRAGMAGVQVVWKVISGKKLRANEYLQMRRELLYLIFGTCLFHTNLGAGISEVATASDASGRGGAVGQATGLSRAGQAFTRSMASSPGGGIEMPILVISLFNGIGGAFRAYDLVGAMPSALIAFDVSKAACRVTSRRWPHATIMGDVRKIDKKMVHSWLLKYPHVEQVDLWGGFPCVDLSVKHNRKNLEGTESGLFSEILRVLELLLQVFGRNFPIYFFVENVASMDRDAAQQISEALGVRPYRLQCSDAVPVSRPRFCWTNRLLPLLPGVQVVDKGGYLEVTALAKYPCTEQWIREDSSWEPEDQETVFPTCMKAIPRTRPPPAPAGLARTPHDARERWAADDYRYPPYQYKDQYILWSAKGWRLLESSERDLLHGYGYEHTSVCWAASDIQRDPVGYEDQRCSLIGDSFSMYSFVIFAWASCFRFLPPLSFSHLAQRMGMAPGFCGHPEATCPLQRGLVYGSEQGNPKLVSDLTRVLLTRVNHTGSDVRITSGSIMNPKAYPRQSAQADWWEWQHVFSCRWQKTEHINRLEMRSILLAFRWRVEHLLESNVRFVHLTDSYVSMSVISKGRSSSLMLMSIMKKIAAYQFGFNLFPILIHVESTENPTDEASRR